MSALPHEGGMKNSCSVREKKGQAERREREYERGKPQLRRERDKKPRVLRGKKGGKKRGD